MSSRNSVKKYIENGYYHIYNRGVEKRKIFLCKQDFAVYLSYLKTYLLPKDIPLLQKQLSNPEITFKTRAKIIQTIALNNFSDEISLLAYCLMPNHFHLIIKQHSPNAIDSFVNSLNTRYVMYFNRKYQRVGPLFQDVYKAVTIDSEKQLIHLTGYIHRNPWKSTRKSIRESDPIKALTKFPSSLPEYFNLRRSAWVNIKEVLSLFGNSQYTKYKKYILRDKISYFTISSKLID